MFPRRRPRGARTVYLWVGVGIVGSVILLGILFLMSIAGHGAPAVDRVVVGSAGVVAARFSSPGVRISHVNWNQGARGPQFYKLETCPTCSEANVMASVCKNYHKDMQVRISLASQGRLMHSEHIWNVLWLCRPDAYPKLKTTLELGACAGRSSARHVTRPAVRRCGPVRAERRPRALRPAPRAVG